MAARVRPTDISVEDWLRAEGISKARKSPPRAKRQHKSLPGQMSLLARDATGAPVVLVSLHEQIKRRNKRLARKKKR